LTKTLANLRNSQYLLCWQYLDIEILKKWNMIYSVTRILKPLATDKDTHLAPEFTDEEPCPVHIPVEPLNEPEVVSDH
jgi:hypothetical protein